MHRPSARRTRLLIPTPYGIHTVPTQHTRHARRSSSYIILAARRQKADAGERGSRSGTPPRTESSGSSGGSTAMHIVQAGAGGIKYHLDTSTGNRNKTPRGLHAPVCPRTWQTFGSKICHQSIRIFLLTFNVVRVKKLCRK